ncbi:TetR/AcrR family transcriptional regulator [Bacillus xiapuensis]|uniref:TetR/AcrR family transcriptional regulator n=1 Tax=Bacillus xiapuensis TaxID=2014075 RepID=UPI000C238B70|nr:TetR/AcrR family transcriptional regulator [Bacillus xiapuensis]
MPKFTQEEKEKIVDSLITEGRHLFSTLGLKKTSISDLTKAVGIAQGSYYLFFQSKEELYFAVLEQEEMKIRSHLAEKYFSANILTKEDFRSFLRESFSIMEQNPFIQQLHQDNLIEALFRKIPAEKLKKHFSEDAQFFLLPIQEAQTKGHMISEDPQIIVSLIRSILLLAFQKEKIGKERYQETIELLITLIAEGLMTVEE